VGQRQIYGLSSPRWIPNAWVYHAHFRSCSIASAALCLNLALVGESTMHFTLCGERASKERHLKYQSASISSSSTLIPVYGLKLHQFKSRRFVLPKHIIPRLFTSGFSPQPLSTSRPVHVKRQEQLNSTCPVVNLPPVLRHGKGTLVAPTPLAHLI